MENRRSHDKSGAGTRVWHIVVGIAILSGGALLGFAGQGFFVRGPVLEERINNLQVGQSEIRAHMDLLATGEQVVKLEKRVNGVFDIAGRTRLLIARTHPEMSPPSLEELGLTSAKYTQVEQEETLRVLSSSPEKEWRTELAALDFFSDDEIDSFVDAWESFKRRTTPAIRKAALNPPRESLDELPEEPAQPSFLATGWLPPSVIDAKNMETEAAPKQLYLSSCQHVADGAQRVLLPFGPAGEWVEFCSTGDSLAFGNWTRPLVAVVDGRGKVVLDGAAAVDTEGQTVTIAVGGVVLGAEDQVVHAREAEEVMMDVAEESTGEAEGEH